METIGQRLKNKRLERKLSLDDVYQSTRIHPRVISALEADEAEETLSQIYIKNFLYDYAKFLGMDSQQIVKEYLDSHPPASLPLLDSVRKIKMPFIFKNLKNRYLTKLKFLPFSVITFFISVVIRNILFKPRLLIPLPLILTK